jgi:lactate dehydrogenase-like 2-hydroxyacid dehydrogenase
MEINELKILVVGIGSIGRRHGDVLYSALGCKNIIVCDKVPSNASSFAVKYPGMEYAASFEEGLDILYIPVLLN